MQTTFKIESPSAAKRAVISLSTVRISTTRRRAALLGLAAILPLAACSEATDTDSETGTFYGAPVTLGEGTARSYVILEEGAAVEVGVALSERALVGLPEDHSPGGIPMPDGHHAFEYDLAMPTRNPTPYRFVGLGWNPAGHEPPGIYDLPHFDFHFYNVPQAERGAIVPADPQWGVKAGRFPAAQFVPQGYQAMSTLMGAEPGAVAVPGMGMHWIDPASPELHGAIFTETFIYGTWDGKMIFAEPMITKAFLETKPNFRTEVATAQSYEQAGTDPSEYRIYWHAPAGEYRVSLNGFGAD